MHTNENYKNRHDIPSNHRGHRTGPNQRRNQRQGSSRDSLPSLFEFCIPYSHNLKAASLRATSNVASVYLSADRYGVVEPGLVMRARDLRS